MFAFILFRSLIMSRGTNMNDQNIPKLQDNLSRGNLGAVHVLQQLFPHPNQLQFIYADLGDKKAVSKFTNDFA